MGNLQPDLTLLLDLPVGQGLSRVKRPNRFEAKPFVYHKRVRAGFLALQRRNPRRIRKISAVAPIQVVQAAIRKEVSRLLR